MEKITQLEDFSGELFLEIFDYLNAFDIFISFSSLNKHISSILYCARLHIIVSKCYCRRQVEILSSYLTDHDNQVVSISLPDQIRDFSSVISFIFDRHTFPNLRSCQFYSICSSSKLYNIIQQLENLTKLSFFMIDQPDKILCSETDKQYLSQTLLMHKSSELRSIKLLFHYDHLNLITNTTFNSTLTSLIMIFNDSSYTCSIYCLLPIFYTYRTLRRLRVRISNDNNLNTRPAIESIFPFSYKDNLPISPSITIFDLRISTMCNFCAFGLILRCMPNLRQLVISAVPSISITYFSGTLFDGYEWQKLLTTYTPYLDIFDLFLYMAYASDLLYMNDVLRSFEYFVTKFHDFHVTINRSQFVPDHAQEQVRLRAFTYSRKVPYSYYLGEKIILDTLNMKSTETTDVQNHLSYSHYKDLHIIVPLKMEIGDHFSLHSQLFKNLDRLVIEIISSHTTIYGIEFDLVDIRRTDNKIHQEERAEKIKRLIDLTRIEKLEFLPINVVSQLHFVEQILLATPNVIHLVIGTELLLNTTLFDNLSLISIFGQLQSLYLIEENVYFSSKYVSKLVKHFSLLVHVELRTFCFDECAFIVDTLLDGLPELVHLKIFFIHVLNIDNPYSIKHVVEKRHRAFPFNICDEDEVLIKTDEQCLEIYLKGCSICA